MARQSNRVKNYASVKGRVDTMTLMDTYYKTVELRTVLKDISLEHKKWGTEWYSFVEVSSFQKAKDALIKNGSGLMALDTLCKINELADLEAHMQELERGTN